jgi:hypothetical protein
LFSFVRFFHTPGCPREIQEILYETLSVLYVEVRSVVLIRLAISHELIVTGQVNKLGTKLEQIHPFLPVV